MPGYVALNGCRVSRALGSAVEIVEATPQDRGFPDRVTETLGVCLKFGPDHEVRADGRALSYPSNTVCVRAPGAVWSAQATGPVGFLSIDLEATLLPPGGLRGPMRFVPPHVLPDLRDVVRELKTGEPLQHEVIVTGLVNQLLDLGLLETAELGVAPPLSAVRAAREYLENAIETPPSLAELARCVGGNRFVLLRQFQRAVGLPPHSFVLRLRVERARTLLVRGNGLAEVAQNVGFADQSHFTRAFKRVMGVTPGVYQRQVRCVR